MNTLTRRETFALEFAKIMVAQDMVHYAVVEKSVNLADELIGRLDDREKLPEARPGLHSF